LVYPGVSWRTAWLVDEATARSRISQYESGTYTPAFTTMCALARVLNVPECYFYILDEEFAEKDLGLYDAENM